MIAKPDDPVLDTIEIDFHRDRFLGSVLCSSFLSAPLFSSLLSRSSAFSLSFSFSFLLGFADFVAAWAERVTRCPWPASRDKSAPYRRRHLELAFAESRLEIAARGEQEIFAIVAESDVARIIPFVCNRN